MGEKSASRRFKPPQKRMGSFENMVMLLFQRVRPQFKLECFYMTGTEKKMMLIALTAFVGTATLCFKLWGAPILLSRSGILSHSH